MTLRTIEQLFSLRGKSAVVTGASRGIGRSIALRLADAGASVTVTSRSILEARETVAEIESCGGSAQAVCADARSAADAKQVVQTVLDGFGRLDILVNNAGVYPFCPALEVSGEQWDEVIETNLKGAFVYAQAAARAMIDGGQGAGSSTYLRCVLSILIKTTLPMPSPRAG